jgi:hypothetical protein
MKKLAFFIAVFIGLNASNVVRRPDEEEGQSIVQHDNHPASSRKLNTIIQSLANHLNIYYYAITKEGVFHRLSWEKIASIVGKRQTNNRITRIVYQMESKSGQEKSRIQIMP